MMIEVSKLRLELTEIINQAAYAVHLASLQKMGMRLLLSFRLKILKNWKH